MSRTPSIAAPVRSRGSLDGTTQLATPHSTALVATNAVAGLAATNPRAVKFVEELWNAAIPSGQFRYYDGMWYLLGLLHCSGEFRVWTPKWAPKRQTGDVLRAFGTGGCVRGAADRPL